MAELEMWLEEATEEAEALNVAGRFTDYGTFSSVAVEEKAVTSFMEKALESASSFKDWVVTKFKSMSVGDAVMLGTGVLMLYQMIKGHAEKAANGGKRISLNSAIAGAQKTLVDNYEQTMRQPAINEKNDPARWDKLPKATQDALDGVIATDGQTYWILKGGDIMVALAEMPIYDPTS